jgi:hypothetical protein
LQQKLDDELPDATGVCRQVIPKKKLSANTPLKMQLVDSALLAATDPIKPKRE